MTAKTQIGLDVDFLNRVIEEGGVDSRKLLACQIAQLLRDPKSSALEADQVSPLAVKLATDPEHIVRSVFAQEIIDAPVLPTELVFAITSDQIEIAKPFLETTRSLTSGHMVAILKAGDEVRQAIIVSRPDFSTEAKSHVLRHGNVKTVLQMLANPVVALSPVEIRGLYERLGNTEVICERLLDMPDLPPDIRVTQARRTASRMLQLMAEKNWLGGSTAKDITSDAEEAAILNVIGSTQGVASSSLMEFLANKNLLTPSLVVRAAASGEMNVVELILSHLAGISKERTRGLVYRPGMSGFQSVFNKSGLPRSCFGLLRAACDVAAEFMNEESVPSPAIFGRRVLEALMTRYEDLDATDRSRQIEFLGRYGDEAVRRIARRLKSDLARAA